MSKPSKRRGKSRPAATPPDAGGGTSYTALKFEQNGYAFYVASIPIDDLYPYCTVPHRTQDPEAGFQRDLHAGHAQDFADYLKDGGFCPLNVALAATPAAHLAYSRASKSLRFRRVPGAFVVLDGQHRTKGFDLCATRHRVFVAICEALPLAVQTRVFYDTNSKAKGLPASLLLDIKAQAERESEYEGRLRALYDRLAGDAGSPLHGRVSPTGTERGKLSRVAWNRAAGALLRDAVPLKLDGERLFRAARCYLDVLAKTLGEDGAARLTRPLFLAAALELFGEISVLAWERFQHLRVEAWEQTMAPLARPNYAAARTKTELLALMRAALATPRDLSAAEMG